MNPKILGTNKNGTIQYQLLTSQYLQAACDVIRNTLFIPGSLNEALGIPTDPEALSELDELSRAVAKDGASVIAIDTNMNQVVGVAFNKFWVKNNQFLENFSESLKNRKSRQILDMIMSTEKICDLFDLLEVDCLMEIFLLGTSPEYRKQGIGQKLCEMSIEVAQESVKPNPGAVTAIFNSSITQKIGQKLSFTIAAERSNTKLEIMGESFEIANGTPTTTVEYKKLTTK